jgi:hypothetical protein
MEKEKPRDLKMATETKTVPYPNLGWGWKIQTRMGLNWGWNLKTC